MIIEGAIKEEAIRQGFHEDERLTGALSFEKGKFRLRISYSPKENCITVTYIHSGNCIYKSDSIYHLCWPTYKDLIEQLKERLSDFISIFSQRNNME